MDGKIAGRIAFQGDPGAYGHQACAEARPDLEALPCATFEEVFAAVRGGVAELGMIAVENTTYGRVADVHQLLPESGLHIVDEAFVRVRINLMAPKGATLADIRRVRAMSILIGQARGFIAEHGLETLNWTDNAAAAREVAQLNDLTEGALASEIAAEIYGLEILARDIEDNDSNTTRFLIMGREPDLSRRGNLGMVTSFVFRVRNIPASLYKALGGFATNGVNMTKLESYMVGGAFTATQFYCEVEGHPDDRSLQLAFEELAYFTDMVRIMGVYPQARRRHI